MLLWKKLLLVFLLCLLGLGILTAILVPILTRPDDDICNNNRIYRRVTLRNGQRSHLEMLRQGLPPVEVPSTRAADPDWGWITQRIDHFNPTDLRNWSMRYLNNSEFYQEGGPMFVFLGGEWEITKGYLQTGQMYDMARETNGYMFYTEHRYYGQSFPTENLCSYNMQYNNADQALADIAYYIEDKKLEIPGMQDSKVVVVGGSYSAMLATWMRMKYPHLVDAALSSSAPLKAKADFYEYYEVVSHNLGLASEECVTTIREAITETETYLNQGNIDLVSEAFRTCDPIDITEPHRSYFFSTLAGPFASIVQYASAGQLEAVCTELLSYSGSSFEKYVSFINNYYGEGRCISDYDYYIDYLSNPLITTAISRQWMYQTCTEYGFYQTSASNNQPFKGFELQLYINLCNDVYEVSEEALDAAIERTNLFYGADDPQVTKVVQVHGTVDPWHPLGILSSDDPEHPVYLVNGTSHCADLLNSNMEAMQQVKANVTQHILEWIQ